VILGFFLIGNVITANVFSEQTTLSLAWEEEKLKSDLKKYAEIIFTLDRHYADSINIEEVIIQSIQRMLTFLDPFSTFHNKDAFRDFQLFQSGIYSGIGANLIEVEGKRIVHSTTLGSPASESGLSPGDIISAINGQKITGFSTLKVKKLLHGEKGSAVKVSVQRFGLENPLELIILRDLLPVPSIPMCLQLKPNVVYIKLTSFSNATQIEFDECLAPHLTYLDGLILDLRDNMGGSLESGVQIADRLLNINDLIMSTQGISSEPRNEYFAKINVKKLDFPVVVIINNKTASSAEILAGAIKDNRRGLIIGQNSFGKGLIQTIFPLKTGHALFLTTGKWFTPSGINIQQNYRNLLRNRLFFSEKINQNDTEITFQKSSYKNSGVEKTGISPNIHLKAKKVSPFLVKALLNRLFFNFSREIWFKYRKLAESEKMNGVLISEFYEFAQNRNIQVSNEEFEKNIGYIKHQLRSNLLLMAGKPLEASIVALKTDPYVLLAIDSLEQARSFL